MEGIKCILLDIEGTICSISFVKDVLFPYALKALPDVLQTQWDDKAFRPYREAFPEDVRESPEALHAHVEDLTRRDVKIAYLKDLQGYLWQTGYEEGAYATPFFSDVVPKLKKWKESGWLIAIYSSGSVKAQKLLFKYALAPESNGQEERRQDPTSSSADGTAAPAGPNFDVDAAGSSMPATEDLQRLIAGWFDTVNAGPKTASDSYAAIAGSLQVKPNEVLFLSDNVKEVDAAIAAGMPSVVVDRPGNSPLSREDSSRHEVVRSLDNIDVRR